MAEKQYTLDEATKTQIRVTRFSPLTHYWTDIHSIDLDSMAAAAPRISETGWDPEKLIAGVEAGHADDMACLGWIYCPHPCSNSLPKNSLMAMKWTRRAAEAGSPFGMGNLGSMYWGGIALDKNQAEGWKWWLKAAEAGNVCAMADLAWFFMNGLPACVKDSRKAMYWWGRAAAAGNGRGIMWLGIMTRQARNRRLFRVLVVLVLVAFVGSGVYWFLPAGLKQSRSSPSTVPMKVAPPPRLR